MRSNSRCSLCLQFALILGAGPVLHRPTSLVIHRLEWNRHRIRSFSLRDYDESTLSFELRFLFFFKLASGGRSYTFRRVAAKATTTTVPTREGARSRSRAPAVRTGDRATDAVTLDRSSSPCHHRATLRTCPAGSDVRRRPRDPRRRTDSIRLRPDAEPYDPLRQVPDRRSSFDDRRPRAPSAPRCVGALSGSRRRSTPPRSSEFLSPFAGRGSTSSYLDFRSSSRRIAEFSRSFDAPLSAHVRRRLDRREFELARSN
jgi:hypothetical protein